MSYLKISMKDNFSAALMKKLHEATKVDKLDFGGFPHWEIGGN